MSKDIVKTTLRLNISNPTQQKAWNYLQTMDKKKFISYSNIIAIAVVEYFEKYYKSKDDPYFETREREEKFIADILDKVEKRLNDLLPQYMFANMMPNTATIQEQMPNNSNLEQDDEDIDWELLESCGNWYQ